MGFNFYFTNFKDHDFGLVNETKMSAQISFYFLLKIFLLLLPDSKNMRQPWILNSSKWIRNDSFDGQMPFLTPWEGQCLNTSGRFFNLFLNFIFTEDADFPIHIWCSMNIRCCWSWSRKVMQSQRKRSEVVFEHFRCGSIQHGRADASSLWERMDLLMILASASV